MTKDLFSKQSGLYATHRPGYPEALFSYILQFVNARRDAWDCATGNGQVAAALAPHFKKVYATDISEQQLSRAVRKPNIQYSIQPAEKTGFPDNQFDLVTVGQAIHWFDFDRFYAEVTRTSRPGAVMAAIGYTYPVVNANVDALLERFNREILSDYWEPERQYIEDNYRTLPFPFEEIDAPAFEAAYEWDAERYIGFLRSWSPVQQYITEHGKDPVDQVAEDLRKAWPDQAGISIRFPVLLRLGRVRK
jgi:hypothetical protein